MKGKKQNYPHGFDYTGATFGRLTVIRRSGFQTLPCRQKQHLVECACACGVVLKVRLASLKNGNTTSCGCRQKEVNIARSTKHGRRHTPEYNVWASMLQRGKGNSNPAEYAERGITVCDRWATSFSNFLSDMGSRPEGHTIDRVDNNKSYSPENCRWATMKDQALNTRRTLRVKFNGELRVLQHLSEEHKINHRVVYDRLRLGWSVEKALTTPVMKMKPRKTQHAKH